MNVTRDLTDPSQIAAGIDHEAGLKEPLFENLEIPEDLGPVTLVVDDHKVKRYAFTHDDYNPWYFGPGPFGGRVAPAGILGNDLVQLFTTRYAASRVVGLHTEEQLWFDSPIFVGEKVTLRGRYVESYVRRDLGYVVMEAEAHGEDGRRLVRHRGVEVLRTVPGAVAGRATAPRGGSEAWISGHYDPSLPQADHARPDLQPGTQLVPAPTQLTQEQASVFSRCGEYVRNIHNDLDLARAAGLHIPIVQGQQQAGLLLASLTRFFGAAWFSHGWLRCKFLQPVPVFEDLTVGGAVTGVDTVDAGRVTIDLEVWVKRSDGSLATVGWARCGIDPAGEPTR
jgi:acyl dehydratase